MSKLHNSSGLLYETGSRNWLSNDRGRLELVLTDVEAQAERTPEALAVAQDQTLLSYGSLNRRANYLARELCSLGAGPEQVIAVLMPRSPELIIAALASWKA